MIVLMDLEWVENNSYHITPTQLAAMRVDRSWNRLSLFTALCRPRDASFHQWDHVAYAGASKNDFLSALSCRTVFERFLTWLEPDDTLLWWGQEAPRRFAELMKIVGLPSIENKSHSIQTAFKTFVCDGKKTKGNPYVLAQARQIPLLKPEHCAANDVRMMQQLLQNVDFKLAYLYQKPPMAETKKRAPVASVRELPFQIDCNAKVIHQNGCEQLPKDAVTIGCHNLAGGLKHNAKPCPVCCKQLWKEYIVKRNMDVIQRSQCNYFYLPSGRSFHRPDCRMILHSEVPPSGTMYYDSCEKTGRTPCKLCCPLPNDRKAKKEKQNTIKKEALTYAEMQAIKRYQQASKERGRIDLSEMTQQQRSDSLTLTATRYAFWAVPGYSTFHTRNCPKLNKLTGIRGFARYNDALHAGYQPCRHCKPSPKQDAIISIPVYNQTREGEKVEDIISFCRSRGFQCTLCKQELTIETAAGRWIVDTGKRPLFIQHQHTDGSGTSELHWQPRMFLSLKDVVLYIEKHDTKLTGDDV